MALKLEAGRKKCLDVLGLGKHASDEEIKKTYKKLALENHPDKSKDPEATAKFQELSKAYYDLTNKYSYHSHNSAYFCECCGGPKYFEEDDCEDFEDDDDDFMYDSDYSDHSDEEEGVHFFFGKVFVDVFSEFIFRRRFQTRKKPNGQRFTAEEQEEDSFFDFVFKKYRGNSEDYVLTEEDLRKFHSYDEWQKSRDPKKRHNQRTRKAKKKVNRKVPLEKPKPLNKKQLLAEQKRRDREMKQLQKEYEIKQEQKNNNKTVKFCFAKDKCDNKDIQQEIQLQNEENRKQEIEASNNLKKLDAQQRRKEKVQLKKEMKEKKKQVQIAAKKKLEEEAPKPKVVPNNKDDITLFLEKQEKLFGTDEKNVELFPMGNVTGPQQTKEKSVKSSLLQQYFCEKDDDKDENNTDKVKSNFGNWESKNTNQNAPLLQKHLQEYRELMKVQPVRHTEQQLKEEKKRQRESQQKKYDEELEKLRRAQKGGNVQETTSKETQDCKYAEITGKTSLKTLMHELDPVEEEFERMRKEHMKRQQELERKRNEEEMMVLKQASIQHQNSKQAPRKWYERKEPIIHKPPEPQRNVSNVWESRHCKQVQLDSLRPSSVEEEEELLQKVLKESQESAAKDEERRKMREQLERKNFIPHQFNIKKPSENKSIWGEEDVPLPTLHTEPVHNKMPGKSWSATVRTNIDTQKNHNMNCSNNAFVSKNNNSEVKELKPVQNLASSKPDSKIDVHNYKQLDGAPPVHTAAKNFKHNNTELLNSKQAQKNSSDHQTPKEIPSPNLTVDIPKCQGELDNWEDEISDAYLPARSPSSLQQYVKWQQNAKTIYSMQEAESSMGMQNNCTEYEEVGDKDKNEVKGDQERCVAEEIHQKRNHIPVASVENSVGISPLKRDYQNENLMCFKKQNAPEPVNKMESEPKASALVQNLPKNTEKSFGQCGKKSSEDWEDDLVVVDSTVDDSVAEHDFEIRNTGEYKNIQSGVFTDHNSQMNKHHVANQSFMKKPEVLYKTDARNEMQTDPAILCKDGMLSRANHQTYQGTPQNGWDSECREVVSNRLPDVRQENIETQMIQKQKRPELTEKQLCTKENSGGLTKNTLFPKQKSGELWDDELLNVSPSAVPVAHIEDHRLPALKNLLAQSSGKESVNKALPCRIPRMPKQLSELRKAQKDKIDKVQVSAGEAEAEPKPCESKKQEVVLTEKKEKQMRYDPPPIPQETEEITTSTQGMTTDLPVGLPPYLVQAYLQYLSQSSDKGKPTTQPTHPLDPQAGVQSTFQPVPPSAFQPMPFPNLQPNPPLQSQPVQPTITNIPRVPMVSPMFMPQGMPNPLMAFSNPILQYSLQQSQLLQQQMMLKQQQMQQQHLAELAHQSSVPETLQNPVISSCQKEHSTVDCKANVDQPHIKAATGQIHQQPDMQEQKQTEQCADPASRPIQSAPLEQGRNSLTMNVPISERKLPPVLQKRREQTLAVQEMIKKIHQNNDMREQGEHSLEREQGRY